MDQRAWMVSAPNSLRPPAHPAQGYVPFDSMKYCVHGKGANFSTATGQHGIGIHGYQQVCSAKRFPIPNQSKTPCVVDSAEVDVQSMSCTQVMASQDQPQSLLTI
jgi:hypothetical protein